MAWNVLLVVSLMGKFAPILQCLVVEDGTLQRPHTQGLAAGTALVELILNNACWLYGKDDEDDKKALLSSSRQRHICY